MFMLDNKPLALDTPFEHNGISYPANWLRLTSSAEKTAIGITEVPDAQPYDDRFYWGLGNPKDLGQCKAMMVGQVKATAGSMLAATDWKVVRAAEGVKPVDADTLTFRSAIRAASDDFETAIDSATTVDDLAALSFEWPKQDDEEAATE